MRKSIALAALAICTAAVPTGQPTALDPTPNLKPEVADGGARQDTVCRDTIQTVRAERGLPMLDRSTASDDEPLFIAAVDKRIDGCSVLVMRQDTSDVRPIPKPDGQTTLRPAR